MTKPSPKTEFDISLLAIVDERYADYAKDLRTGSKYDAIFVQVKKDMRLRCPHESASRIAVQLKKWLERRGHKDVVVRSLADCGDKMGGVWWLDAKEGVEQPCAAPAPAASMRRVGTTIAPNSPWPAAPRKAA